MPSYGSYNLKKVNIILIVDPKHNQLNATHLKTHARTAESLSSTESDLIPSQEPVYTAGTRDFTDTCLQTSPRLQTRQFCTADVVILWLIS